MQTNETYDVVGWDPVKPGHRWSYRLRALVVPGEAERVFYLVRKEGLQWKPMRLKELNESGVIFRRQEVELASQAGNRFGTGAFYFQTEESAIGAIEQMRQAWEQANTKYLGALQEEEKRKLQARKDMEEKRRKKPWVIQGKKTYR